MRLIPIVIGALLLISATGCSGNEQTAPIPSTTETQATISFLALGDSYTVGEQVGKLESWPMQLTRKLRVAGRGTAEPTIIAVSGWDTSELIEALTLVDLVSSFDVVTLQIGVNNQFRNGPLVDFESDLDGLTNSAIALAQGNAKKVVLISIPDWSATPFANGAPRKEISAEIDQFNDIVRTQATKSGTQFVDITEVSREATNDLDLVAPDGLHPSGKMFERWVELIFPVVEESVDAD
jgi:lysophospholipase L1-like esterase